MYAGTFGRGVFKSTDGGENWQPTGLAGTFVGAMAIDSLQPNTVYASASWISSSPDWGVHKSIDGGMSWTNLGPVGPLAWTIQTLAVDPKNSSILYAGDGGCCGNSGLYKTTDGGMTWSLVPGMEYCYMVDVVIMPDPAIQYAGGSCDGDRLIGRVLKSTDAGATWKDMNSGLPETRQNIFALVVDPDHPQILYASFFRIGVFRSVDGGANWAPFNDGLEDLTVYSMALSHGTENTVYANTQYRLFKVTDTSLITTNIQFDPASVRAGSSFNATFSGTNLTEATYFDVRFRSPGSNSDQLVSNWQRGTTATHQIPVDADGGIWTITGVRAHLEVDDHNADYVLSSATLAVSRVVVNSVQIDSALVRAGGSFTATFSGANLSDETYFDVRFRSPGSSIDQLALNWQKGTSAKHDLQSTVAVGTWTITGVWAHQLPNDHSPDFAPLSTTFMVIP
jgi:hypothetical protein